MGQWTGERSRVAGLLYEKSRLRVSYVRRAKAATLPWCLSPARPLSSELRRAYYGFLVYRIVQRENRHVVYVARNFLKNDASEAGIRRFSTASTVYSLAPVIGTCCFARCSDTGASTRRSVHRLYNATPVGDACSFSGWRTPPLHTSPVPLCFFERSNNHTFISPCWV